MRRCWWFLLAAGCAVEPSSPAPPLPRIVTAHLVVVGDVLPQTAIAYEQHAAVVESALGVDLPPIELHPRGPDDETGPDAVTCRDARIDCVPALTGAIVDATIADLPRVLRDGLVDMLSGGLGHGDVLDYPVARAAFDLAALLDDAEYARRRDAALAREFGALTWAYGTIYPAGDFVAFLLARYGLDAFARPRAFVAELDAWRASPATTGRMYRLAARECSAAPLPLNVATPLDAQTDVLYAPDLLDPVAHFAIRTFTLAAPTTVAIATPAPFRVESCTDPTVPAFTSGRAALPPGRYFLVASGPTAQVVNTSR